MSHVPSATFILCCKSNANHTSSFLQTLKSNPGTTPQLYQAHGQTDELVPTEWGKTTSQKLTALGVNACFHTYPIAHDMNWKEIDGWTKWVKEMLPQKS